MNIEEYKKELENWKKEHTNFYNECLHAMKNRKATLGAFMHIYDYAMSELPNLPEQIYGQRYKFLRTAGTKY